MRINCYKEQKTKVILHKRLKYSFVDYLYISFDGNFELVCKKAHNRLSFTDCVLTFSVISLWRGAVCLAHPGKEGKGRRGLPLLLNLPVFLLTNSPPPRQLTRGRNIINVQIYISLFMYAESCVNKLFLLLTFIAIV